MKLQCSIIQPFSFLTKHYMSTAIIFPLENQHVFWAICLSAQSSEAVLLTRGIAHDRNRGAFKSWKLKISSVQTNHISHMKMMKWFVALRLSLSLSAGIWKRMKILWLICTMMVHHTTQHTKIFIRFGSKLFWHVAKNKSDILKIQIPKHAFLGFYIQCYIYRLENTFEWN